MLENRFNYYCELRRHVYDVMCLGIGFNPFVKALLKTSNEACVVMPLIGLCLGLDLFLDILVVNFDRIILIVLFN